MARYEPYPALKAGESRWQRSARPVARKPGDPDRADVAIYISGLQVSGPEGNDLEVLRTAVSDRLDKLIEINKAYVAQGGPDDTVSRVPIYGNAEAARVFEELDELIDLARSTFPDPDQLHDWMAKAFSRHFTAGLLQEHGDKATTLELALQCADDWGTARFRFLSHSMRDMPDWWSAATEPQAKAWGDAANELIHGASVCTDADMVMTRSNSSKQAERMFEATYGMASAEARRLNEHARRSARLHPQGKDTLLWAETMINRVVDWKVELLRAYTRSLLNKPAFRRAGAGRQKELRREHYAAIAPELAAVDRFYAAFLGQLGRCLNAASESGSLSPDLVRSLRTSSRALARALAHSPANARAHGTDSAKEICQHWPARGPGDRFSADPPGGRACLERLVPGHESPKKRSGSSGSAGPAKRESVGSAADQKPATRPRKRR